MYDLFLMIVTARPNVILSYMLLSAMLAVVNLLLIYFVLVC